MLPLVDDVLPLYQIAEYWSRELANIRQSEEIFDELLSNFWLNKLHVTGRSGSNKVCRRDVLKIVARQREHPRFEFIEKIEDKPCAMLLPSGGIVIDVTNYVVLPAHEATWTDEITDAAYEKMSEMSFHDFDDLIKPGFIGFCTTRQVLGNYCETMGYSLPRFWFAAGDDGRRWTGRREKEAEAWFKELVKGHREKPRSAYLAEAKKKFPGMPIAAFDRIWRKRAPDEWKKSGPIQTRGAGIKR